MILKPVKTGSRSSIKVHLGIFAAWVVQVCGAYSTRSKFAGLLSATYQHPAYVRLKLRDVLILVQILEK